MFPDLEHWLKLSCDTVCLIISDRDILFCLNFLHVLRMHPLLVTYSKEQERGAVRWKGLGEVRDPGPSSSSSPVL